MDKLYFASDYMEGAHENIMRKLAATNLEKTTGYGTDPYTLSAQDRIRHACGIPGAEVFFLVGGTQANVTVIDLFCQPWQGVISASTGHISVHEAGAVEYHGHKVLCLPEINGKINAEQIRKFTADFYGDGNHDHMVFPGMVYLSQPTEYGTLYSLAELEAIRKVCDEYSMHLFVDGARLAYALAAPENDVTLKDLARLSDVFYIGGTKCAALFGEAIVIPDPSKVPHLVTRVKQHGALLAKGRILGIQFDELFTDGLYEKVGQTAIKASVKIVNALKELGYQLYLPIQTNQIFVVWKNELLDALAEEVVYNFMEKYDEEHTVIRFATSWATTEQDTDALIEVLERFAGK